MSDKTPRDEFDELWYEYTAGMSDELTEETSFTFDEEYADSGSAPPERKEPAREADDHDDKVDALLSAFRSMSRKTEPEKTPEPAAEKTTEKAPAADSGEKVDAVMAAFRRTNGRPNGTPAKPAGEQEPKPKEKKAPDAGKNRVPERKPVEKRPAGEKKAASEKRPAGQKAMKPVKAKSGSAETPEAALVAPKKKSRKKARRPMELMNREPDPVTIGRRLRGDQMLVYDSELDEIDYTDEDDLPEARDYLPIRFRRYGRVGIGGGVMYALFVISISIVLACLAWMFAADVLALNKESRNAVVVIEPYEPAEGEPTVTVVDDTEREIRVDIDQVATELKNNGIIEYKWLFKLFSKFSHAETKMDPGTYDVSTEFDYRAIVTALQFGSGNQEITRVTFPEGYTLEQVFTLLEENQICHKSDLYEASANYEFNYDFLEGLPLGDPNRLEGYLFPDTYDFYQNEPASVALNRFLRNLNNKLTDEVRAAAENRGLSIHELLTMASLIEKEAGGDEERPVMASVIYNRLGVGMPLQLDSTLNYIKGTSTFDLTYEDIEIDDPYNTYQNTGLPPGPICNPGAASIQAVVAPDSTDYWYWYSVDGETHFFTNADEFNAFADANPY